MSFTIHRELLFLFLFLRKDSYFLFFYINFISWGSSAKHLTKFFITRIILLMGSFICIFLIGSILFLPVIKSKINKETFIGKEKQNLLVQTVIEEHNIEIIAKKEIAKEKVICTDYIVQPNDTLWAISRKFGLNLSTIISANNLTTNILRPGTTLKIPSQKGIAYKVKKGQSLWDISRKFNVSLDKIKEANEITTNTIRPGQKLFIPGVSLTQEVVFAQQFSDRFIKPVFGYVSSSFGHRIHPIFRKYHFHAGVDLKAPYGSTVRASQSGRVIFTGWKTGYGKCIIIKHNNVYKTIYGHLSRISVNPGQYVKGSDPIGTVGNSGLTTGAHLHFEVLKNNRPIDPLSLIR